MQQENDLNLPMEIGPVPRNYVVVCYGIAVGFPVIFWVAATMQAKSVSLQSLAAVPVACVCMILYMKGTTVRLGEGGIGKGLPLLGTFIPYERIAGVSKQVLPKRYSPTAFVISERDSGRRIVIPIGPVDRPALARMMAALTRRAPQAQIDKELTYVQLGRGFSFGGRS